MIIEMVEDYNPKQLIKQIFINTKINLFKEWFHVLNDSEVKYAVKEKYSNQKLSEMITDQNYSYPKYNHTLREHKPSQKKHC